MSVPSRSSSSIGREVLALQALSDVAFSAATTTSTNAAAASPPLAAAAASAAAVSSASAAGVSVSRHLPTVSSPSRVSGSSILQHSLARSVAAQKLGGVKKLLDLQSNSTTNTTATSSPTTPSSLLSPLPSSTATSGLSGGATKPSLFGTVPAPSSSSSAVASSPPSSSSSSSRESVISAATAAFIAAQEAAKLAGPGPVPGAGPSAVRRTMSHHMPPPPLPTAQQQALANKMNKRTESAAKGTTVPAGITVAAGTSNELGNAPPLNYASAATSQNFSSPFTFTPMTMQPTPGSAAAAAAATTPFTLPLSSSSHPSSSSPSPLRHSCAPLLLSCSLLSSLRSLCSLSPHSNSSQAHLMLGLAHQARAEWTEAEAALRKADQLYATTLSAGSLIQRINHSAAAATAATTNAEANSAQTTHAATAAASSSAAPSRAPSYTEDLDLTQPMDMDAGMDADDATPPAETALSTPTVSSAQVGAQKRTPFVARKAAEIKIALANAIWKRVFYANATTNPSTTTGAAADSSSSSSSSAAALAEAKRLFLDALELEGGQRLNSWNSLCVFVCATHSAEVAKSILLHVVAQFKLKEEERKLRAKEAASDAAATAASSAHTNQQQATEEDASDRAGNWALDNLQANLALMQLMNGSTDDETDALFNLQDVLANSAKNDTHHLGAMNNYAIILMKQQQDYASAQKLFEFLLQHDSQNSTFWSNLAVCYSMQLKLQHEGIGNHPNASAAASSSALARTTSSLLTSPFAPNLLLTAQDEMLMQNDLHDEQLLANIEFCYEKARFYEALDQPTIAAPTTPANTTSTPSTQTTAAGKKKPVSSPPLPTHTEPSSPSSSSSSSTPLGTNCVFRLNVAQNLLKSARAEVSPSLRDQMYAACEKILLSIAAPGTPSSATILNQLNTATPIALFNAIRLDSAPSSSACYSQIYCALGNLYSARSLSFLSDRAPSTFLSSSKQLKEFSIAAYALSLRIDPFNECAWNQLSILFLHSADVKEAKGFIRGMINRIRAQMKLQIKTQAEEKENQTDPELNEYQPLSANDFLTLDSSPPAHLRQLAAVLCNYAVSLQLCSFPVASERAYLDSLRLSPLSAPTYMNLGNLYRSTQRIPDALKAFSRALEIKPNYAMAAMNLALVYIQTEDWIQAYHYMEKANGFNPNLMCIRSNRSKLSILLTKLGFVLPLPDPSLFPSSSFPSVREVNELTARNFESAASLSAQIMFQSKKSTTSSITGMLNKINRKQSAAQTKQRRESGNASRTKGEDKKKRAHTNKKKEGDTPNKRKKPADTTPSSDDDDMEEDAEDDDDDSDEDEDGEDDEEGEEDDSDASTDEDANTPIIFPTINTTTK